MTKRRTALLLTAALAAISASSAAAQTVFRCGSSSYADSPCPQARVVDVDDARTDAQREQALRLAANDRQLADRMAAQRREQEAIDKKAGAASRSKAAKRARVSRIRWFKP